MTQQGDVLLCQTNDDGDINVENGAVEMSGGLPTAAYLSLFGGNEDDPAGQDAIFSWWGNLLESEPEKQYRSETQNLLETIPAVSRNLLRLEDAANRDLAWLIDIGAAASITVNASIPKLNTIQLVINIEAGSTLSLTFVENWRAQ